MTTKKLAQYILIGVCISIIVATFVIIKYYPPNGVLVCKLKSAPGDTYASYTYTIDFKFWKATNFVSEEKLHSDNKEMLTSYEQEMKNIVTNGYFKNETSLSEDELVIKTIVNYNDLVNERKNSHVKAKLGIVSMKKVYTEIGATCKYN